MSTRYLSVFALLATFGLTAKSAHADVPVSLDIDYALPVDAGPVGDGFGGALRFGPRLDLAIITFSPEASLGVHALSGPAGPTVYRGTVGTRWSLGVLLRPSIYGHIGVGHADWFTASDVTHLTLDAGAALDLRVVPAFEVGVHAAYNVLFGDSPVGTLGFMALGGHITIVLDRNHD